MNLFRVDVLSPLFEGDIDQVPMFSKLYEAYGARAFLQGEMSDLRDLDPGEVWYAPDEYWRMWGTSLFRVEAKDPLNGLYVLEFDVKGKFVSLDYPAIRNHLIHESYTSFESFASDNWKILFASKP